MAGDAFERALAALGRREHTTAELESWLVDRGFDEAEVASAIARLIETEALDDEQFARRYAEDKRELRGWGPERIREALEARGLDSGLIAAALAADQPGAQLERAVELLEHRGQPAEDDAARARALAFLVRRGYDSEVAYAAIRRHRAPNRA